MDTYIFFLLLYAFYAELDSAALHAIEILYKKDYSLVLKISTRAVKLPSRVTT